MDHIDHANRLRVLLMDMFWVITKDASTSDNRCKHGRGDSVGMRCLRVLLYSMESLYAAQRVCKCRMNLNTI